MKDEVLKLKTKTQNGKVLKQEENQSKKKIARLEKKLQLARIQLSVAHSENSELRKAIDTMRLNKILYLQIRNDMVNSLRHPLLRTIFSN